MIIDLLPRFSEGPGKDATYTILRSFVLNEHEIAWMERAERPRFAWLGASRKSWRLYCECDFTEGVGWINAPAQGFWYADGRVPLLCAWRQEVLELRCLELRCEYETGSRTGWKAPRIIVDLVSRLKNNEFIGGDDCYALSAQTISVIANISMEAARGYMAELVGQNKVSYAGASVKAYEPGA